VAEAVEEPLRIEVTELVAEMASLRREIAELRERRTL
jgi:voltage-gated potassium channel